ncbi:MAG TPA: alpha/beta hydrolase-fold protein [Polyangia bacterium]
MLKTYLVATVLAGGCAGLSLAACTASSDSVGPAGSGGASGSGGSPVTSSGTGGGSGGSGSGSGGKISAEPDAAADSGSGGGVGTGGTNGTDGASVDVSGPESGADSGTVDPGSEGDGMRTIPQPFKTAPETQSQSGVPHGSRIKFTMAHGSSQRYPNAVDREINVYVPSQYVKGMPAPVIVVQDGNNFFGFVDLLSNTLDNLIGTNKLPPIVAVYANNGGGDAQGSERGKEYDTLSGVYAEWVDQELLPQVEQQTLKQLPTKAVTFTKDPEGRGSLGGSSGGVASFIMAWYHPDLFRRVIGYSPSFVAQEFPINPDHPLGAWNFHEDNNMDDGGIIAKTSPNLPVRAWLECGTNDDGAGTALVPNTQYPHYDFYYAVTRTGEKLTGKGYHVHYDVGTGAGHVDGGMVQATLPEAVLWAWRGYQSAQ